MEISEIILQTISKKRQTYLVFLLRQQKPIQNSLEEHVQSHLYIYVEMHKKLIFNTTRVSAPWKI